MLTETALAGRFAGGPAEVCCLDALRPSPSDDNPVPLASPDDLAYVIYTSGTTGQPKGTMVTHANVARLFRETEAWYGFHNGDRWPLFHSPAFDVSVWEIWGALLHGGQLIIVPRDITRSPDEFRALLSREKVTVLNQTPSAFRQLIDADGRAPADRTLHLRYVILAGEPLSMPMLRAWFDRHGDTCPRVVNMYGITETTVHVTYRPVSAADLGSGSMIGCPIPDMSVHILDEAGEPAPAGVAGELHVAGAGVARGYLNRPDLTRERFVTRSVDGRPPEVFYRSGDLVRRHDDGDIEYLGRIDDQIKIRGFRIEPGEIEALLSRHPGVHACVVIKREDRIGDPRLVAYVVPTDATSPTREDLQRHLRTRLPDYMVPSTFVTLAALPLTTNGKVDRRALPRPWTSQATPIAVGSPVASSSDRTGDRAPTLQASRMACPAPLSFAQRRLWFIDQLQPGTAAYNVVHATRLRGRLDIEALRESIDAVVERHTILRTTFEVFDDEPRQVIHPGDTAPVSFIDLAAYPDAERTVELERRLCAQAARPFDLANEWPLRISIFRLGENEHVLMVTVHHIAFDGWSLGILWHEVGALYGAKVSGTAASLARPPLQYAEFAGWQREWLQGPRLKCQLDYWLAQLRDMAPLELPTDHPRRALPLRRVQSVGVTIDAVTAHRLRGLGRAEQATPFIVLLSAFQVLLARYTGQEDIAVGSPVANRPRVEFERLIGLFVNTLVFRTDLSGEPSFRELIARVRRTALSAYEHQDLPFERLVEELHPERDLGRNPLVQVVFALQNAPMSPLTLHGLEASPVAVGDQHARFDLELHLHETANGGLDGNLIYATDLFEPSTIERMAGHFDVLLRSAASSPDAPIGTLPILTELERKRILIDWNATAVPQPALPVHRLFEAQVNRTPNAVALTWRNQQVTYAELNSRANRLARYLGSKGISPGFLVAVALQRSVDSVVALLGVLKAGAAYVPIDPADPRARQSQLLDDSGANALIVDEHHDASPGAAVRMVVHLADDARAIGQQADADLEVTASPDDLAYVMYTSGSTGTPKGVEIPHRAIVRLVYGGVVPLGPSDALLQLAPHAFDASTFEIWSPLLHGARLVLYPEPALDLAVLEDVLRAERVSHAWLTASLFNLVVDRRPEALDGVSWLVTGGEALSVPHVSRALELYPTMRLVNGYGPTEVTTFSCVHPIERPCRCDQRSIPIGRPIGNTTAYVLDARLQPVPIGIPGTLYLGGAGLARGYRYRPDLTEERFVANPFVEGERLYDSGDRVRYLADGTLDFLGRTDHQVKLRGFRVELGEVEAVLGRHPAVDACVATIDDDRSGERRLVAYVVPHASAVVAAADVIAFLRERLPHHMVPSLIVPVPSLPLTPGGKIDRRALPAIAARAVATEALERRLNSTEARLATLWRTVLGVEHFGLGDSFFDLGGHSLMAVGLFSRIEREFGRRLPLSALFTNGTLESLARLLNDEVADPGWSPLVPIQPEGSRPPLFVMHGIGGEVTSFRALARHLGPDQPVFGLQAAGPGAGEKSPTDIVELARRYADIIAEADHRRPCFVAGYSSGGPLALEVARRLQERGREVPLLLLVDAGLPEQHDRSRKDRGIAPIALIRHLSYWVLDDVLTPGPHALKGRIESKLRLGRARIKKILHLEGGEPDILDVLGLWKYPADYRQYIKERYEAFLRYEARAYSGKVVFVRGRTLPLLRPSGSEERWRSIAKGAFDVKIVRGNHDNLLHEPQVIPLARVVRNALDSVLLDGT